MSDDRPSAPPPFPGASFPPPPRAASPLAGDAARDADERLARSVRGAKRLAAWSIGIAVAGGLCCGGGGLALTTVFARAAADQEEALRGAQRNATERRDTEALLATLADGLRASGGELPESLPEAPPRDAWGTPVRYRRGGTDATLTSAGPDQRFGTRDDVVVRVEPPK